MFRFLIIIALTFILPASAQAEQGVYQCGEPVEGDIETDPGFSFCDIYQRQLAFKDVRDRLSRQLRERQENFAEPRRQAYEAYQRDLKALHRSIE